MAQRESSPRNVEHELKIGLPNEKAYQDLLNALAQAELKVVEQINHFFDTPERCLNTRRFILRLRQEDEIFYLTAKGKSKRSEDPLWSKKVEVESVIDVDLAQSILRGEACPLVLLSENAQVGDEGRILLLTMRELVGTSVLSSIGKFSNRRTRCPIRVGSLEQAKTLELEVDRTRFPNGRIDCEVELEIPDSVEPELAKKTLVDLLERLGIRGHANPSKSKRFFQILRSGE